MKKFLFVFLFWTLVCGGTLSAQNRWSINPDGSISWNVKDRIPHYDHIEMSGLKVSTVLRYGVNADGSFELNKSMVWLILYYINGYSHITFIIIPLLIRVTNILHRYRFSIFHVNRMRTSRNIIVDDPNTLRVFNRYSMFIYRFNNIIPNKNIIV